jgi:lipid II:glycine glycyltransferase (peptidoglycan interpeptide bridge formation enzyme)
VDRADAVHKLVRAVVRRTRKLRPIGGTLVLDPLIDDDERELWRAAAVAAGLGVEPTWTYAAQVRPTEEEMLAAIKAERRKAARKAAREGVTLDHRRDLDGFREYYDVRAQTRTRNDLPPVPWSHFEQTHAALAGSDVYHVFLARSGDRIGAGQIAFAYGGYVFLSGVSVADWALAEKSPANDFLQWQVLAWAVETGQDVVDFSGADPNSTDPKVQGIDRFKSRWGTELHESLRLEVPGSRLRARAARLAARVGR